MAGKTIKRVGGALALCAGLAWSGAQANAQNNRNPRPDPNAPLADRLLPRGKTEQWVLVVDIYYPGLRLDAPPLNHQGVIRPDFDPMHRTVLPGEWQKVMQMAAKGVEFKTAAMVFPVPLATAGHAAQMGTFTSQMKLDGQVIATEEPKFTEGYQSGERLARWDMRDVSGRRLNLRIKVPVTCWETGFNEEEAARIDWPKGEWPAVVKSALEPVYLVEWATEEKEIAESKRLLDGLRNNWLNQRDPKTIKPVALAKELAGRVQEFCDNSGGDSVYQTAPGNVLGLITMTVPEVMGSKRCLRLDPASFLAAVYRNAGLPARTVYGYDMSGELDRLAGRSGWSTITAWTEFAVMDEKSGSVVWVPVDVLRLRLSGSRMQRLDRPWRFFGQHDDLDYMIPISFHAHPPTGVTVRGLPAFWGWLCTPETPALPHSIRIEAVAQNSREKQRNDESERNQNNRQRP